MVSSALVDSLIDPEAMIQNLYLQSHGPQNVDSFPTRVADHFSGIFASTDAFLEASRRKTCIQESYS